MRRGSQGHQAMRRAARVCGFDRQLGELQAQPKLQQLFSRTEEAAARGGRNEGAGSGCGVASRGGTGKEEGTGGKEATGG